MGRSKSWGGWSGVGGVWLGSEGMELGSEGFKSDGWGLGGQRSWGVRVEGVGVGVGRVWIEGSSWNRGGRRDWDRGVWGWVREVGLGELGSGGLGLRKLIGIRGLIVVGGEVGVEIVGIKRVGGVRVGLGGRGDGVGFGGVQVRGFGIGRSEELGSGRGVGVRG